MFIILQSKKKGEFKKSKLRGKVYLPEYWKKVATGMFIDIK